MRILFISPQPYYEERGTLIAIDLLLKALSERGDQVHLLTLHLGEDRDYPGLQTIRIRPRPAPSRVRPGLSAAKIWCDLFVAGRAFSLMRRNRYDLVYAVEEGAFIAMLLGLAFRKPFVFDMDSSMADQVIERYPWAGPIGPLLRWLESLPMRRAAAVIPMCEALADRARLYCPNFVETLKDVSLVKEHEKPLQPEDLRLELRIDGPIAMYIGNLEPYQGIDLLLESFRLARQSADDAALIVIGGSDGDIEKYREKVELYGLADAVHLLGRRPVSQLGYFMTQADVLVSPRITGINTPMKVYSYLDSGAPVIATNLPTHTQVMTEDVAKLPEPDPASFSQALIELFTNPEERQRLAGNAKDLVRREHSEEAFRSQVGQIFERLEKQLATG